MRSIIMFMAFLIVCFSASAYYLGGTAMVFFSWSGLIITTVAMSMAVKSAVTESMVEILDAYTEIFMKNTQNVQVQQKES